MAFTNFPGFARKLDTKTASASATIDFALPTGYCRFEVIITGVKPVTDGDDFWIRTSTDGGSTYDAGSTDYAYSFTTINDAAGTGVTADTGSSRIILEASLGNAANEFNSFVINLYNPSASNYFHITSEGSGTNTTGVFRGITGMGIRKAAADVTNVRFMMSSGNISTGIFTLFGYPS